MGHLVKVTLDTFGKIDILFNNAGIEQKYTDIGQMDELEWDRVFAVNLKGVFFGVKCVLPEMKRGGGGVIINTGSMMGVRVRPGFAAYVASKGAVNTLTKALAIELARYNIRVNCINPVATRTPMILRNIGINLKEEHLLSTIPLGRLAEPEEVAYAALYLASNESSMVTGTSLNVDGGRGV